jgi:hypothetical protein
MTVYEILIRLDFVAAVGLLVVGPLVLLAGSVSAPTVRNRLLAYWRASALLGITVYLWAGEVSGGFVTGFAAHVAILLSLWQGDILSPRPGTPLSSEQGWWAIAFRYWRWAASIYVTTGLACTFFLLPCAFVDPSAVCQAWYGPPQQYARWLHPNASPMQWASYGGWALAIYAVYGGAWALQLARGESE